MADRARLLSAIADALNNAERQGVIVDLEHGAAMTRYGYVVASGDGRLGSRWAARTRLWPAEPPDGGDGNDPGPIEIGPAWLRVLVSQAI